MSLQDIKQNIQQRTANLAVIGLGYVGLPVAAMFAEAGFQVTGIELKADRVEKINKGISPIEGKEPGLAEMLAKVVSSGKLFATTDYSQLKNCDIILIDVETPVDEHNVPRYEALRSALENLASVLKTGALVIIESTIAPGTMKNTVVPLLEKTNHHKVNQDFYLGNCPERVMPGKLISNLKNLSRVVGGGTPETAEVMVDLYQYIVQGDLDAVDWVTAELVKTVENAYRDVQIAFSNEVALICEAMGGNVWKVRELVNKSPFRNMHLPGAGVGGHCIPKDSWLLSYGVNNHNVPLKLIPAARIVNDSMPAHMADLTNRGLSEAGININNACVLVMGYAYLEDTDDTRNSPSEILVKKLNELGASTIIHDPYIAEYQGDLWQSMQKCDAAIVMVAHSEYKNIDLAKVSTVLKSSVLVDGRNLYNKEDAENQGLIFKAVGQ